MANFALGLLNTATRTANGTVATFSDASAALSSTNLTNRQIKKVWRSGLDSAYTLSGDTPSWPYFNRTISGVAGYGASVGAIALLNTNTSADAPGAGHTQQFRVRAMKAPTINVNYTLGNGSGFPHTGICRQVATSVGGTSNLAGLVSTVQAVDGSFMVATVPTSNTVALFDFAFVTNTLPLRSGAGLQAFIVQVRRSGSGGTDPTVTLDLYESGVAKTTNLATVTVTNTAGQWVCGTWDASALTSLSTSGAQLRVTGTAGTTQTVEYGYVFWAAEHTGYDYDSGVLTPSYPPYNYANSTTARTDLFAILPSAITDWAGTGSVTSFLIDQTFTDTSYAEAGYIYVGPLWRPTVNIEWDPKIWWEDPTTFTKSTGGQTWSNVKDRYRVVSFDAQNLTESEAYSDLFDFDRNNGTSGEILVAMDTANTNRTRDWVFLGRVRDSGQVGNKWVDTYQKAMTIEELI